MPPLAGRTSGQKIFLTLRFKALQTNVWPPFEHFGDFLSFRKTIKFFQSGHRTGPRQFEHSTRQPRIQFLACLQTQAVNKSLRYPHRGK